MNKVLAVIFVAIFAMCCSPVETFAGDPCDLDSGGTEQACQGMILLSKLAQAEANDAQAQSTLRIVQGQLATKQKRLEDWAAYFSAYVGMK